MTGSRPTSSPGGSTAFYRATRSSTRSAPASRAGSPSTPVRPGAAVWRKDYAAPDSTWVLLGRTPLDSALLAIAGGGGGFAQRQPPADRGAGVSDPRAGGASVPGLGDPARPGRRASRARWSGSRAASSDVFYPGFEHIKPVRLGDYLMDRLEVTNRDYKRFVDSGGYRRREFWEPPFLKDGRAIVLGAGDGTDDRPHRPPGPSTWEAGEYPAGAGDYPVGGVSWYEAAAFARFAGKALPTVAHWNHAAGIYQQRLDRPAEQFLGQGARPRRHQPAPSAPSAPSTWPATCASGASTPAATSGSSWAAAGTTSRTSSTTPTPSRRSTDRRPMGSGW